jgi:hypothetical protein
MENSIDVSEVKKINEESADDYIIKPFHADGQVVRIETALL